MLRGVNRQVVEVKQPENTCFEKVLFFVSPDHYGMSETALQTKMNDMLKKTTYTPTKTKSKKRIIIEIMKIAFSVLIGAVGSAVVILFC